MLVKLNLLKNNLDDTISDFLNYFSLLQGQIEDS